MKTKFKKMCSLMLALAMIISLLPTNVYAEEIATPTDPTVTETTEEGTTEIITEESTSEEVIVEENFVVFDHIYNDIDVSNIKTTELFVQTNDASVFTKNTNVVSNYDNVYIISCETVEEAQSMYSYYIDKVDYITDLQNTIELQENEETEDVADLSDVNTESEDAIANLEETKSETEEALDTVEDKNYSEYIALIDSGIDESVLGDNDISVSVLGDDLKDNVGHGTKMYNYIKEENPNAKILSIKAFDKNTSDVASIYAAIKLAIESKVSVINLSFTGLDIEKNEILKDIIQEAIDNNITVIGAAGNNNGDSAKNYIPGCIDDVVVIGAVNEDQTLYVKSNCDADFYVIASSTSEATARYSGIYTSGNQSDKVFTEYKTEADNTPTTEDVTTEETSAEENVTENDAKFLVKYTFITEESLNEIENKTIDNVMKYYNDKIVFTYMDYPEVEKYDENTYKFSINDAWEKNIAQGQVVDYVFANANDNGEVVTDGVNLDINTNTAYVNKDAFKNSDFATGQIQVLIKINTSLFENEDDDFHLASPIFNGSPKLITVTNKNNIAFLKDHCNKIGDTLSYNVTAQYDGSYVSTGVPSGFYTSSAGHWAIKINSCRTDSDFTSFNGESISAACFHVSNRSLEGFDDMTATFTLYDKEVSADKKTITKYFHVTTDAWVCGPNQSASGAIAVQYTVEETSYPYIHKYISYGSQTKDIGGVVFSVRLKKSGKIIGYLHTSSSTGNAARLYSIYGVVHNEYTNVHYAGQSSDETGYGYVDGTTGAIKVKPKTSVYIKELGVPYRDDDGVMVKAKKDANGNYTNSPGSNYYTRTMGGTEYWFRKPTAKFSVPNGSGGTTTVTVTASSLLSTSVKTVKDISTATPKGFDNSVDYLVLAIYKTNEKSKPLKGAKFTITDNTTKKSVTLTTNSNGLIVCGKIDSDIITSKHTYTAVEIEAPTGYIINSTPFTLKPISLDIDDFDADTTYNELKEQTEDDKDIKNWVNKLHPRYIAVKKLDSNGNPVPGVKFNLEFKYYTNGINFDAQGNLIECHKNGKNVREDYSDYGYKFKNPSTDAVVTSVTTDNNGVAIVKVTDLGALNVPCAVTFIEAEPAASNTKALALWNYTPDGTTYPNRGAKISRVLHTYASSSNVNYNDAYAAADNYTLSNVITKRLRVRKVMRAQTTYTGTVQYNVYKSLSDAQNNKNVVKTYTANLDGNWTAYQDISNNMNKNTNNEWVDTTFYIKEISCTNAKVRLNNRIKTITIKGSYTNQADNAVSFAEIQNDAEVPIRIKKTSSNPDCTDGNPNYNVQGATYKIFENKTDAQAALTSRDFSKAIKNADLVIGANGTSNTIDITNINGVNYLRPNNAEYNQQRTFYLVESTPGTGYLNNSNIIPIPVPANLPSGREYMEYSVKDEPVKDPIIFVLDKHDDAVNEDLVDEEQKAKNLAALVGTEFTINYYAESIIEGNFLTKDDLLRLTPTRTETAVAKYNESTGQVEAKFDVVDDPFPRGYIVIKEITPTSNYTTDGMKITLNNVDITGKEVFLSDFKYRDATQTTYDAVTYYPGSAKNYSELLDSNGNPNTSKGVMAMNSNEASGSVSITPKVTNKPIRGDVDWEKYFIETVESEEEKPMANVKFSITNKDTGEKHYFYTGADGKANTSTTEYKPDIINHYDNVDDYDGTASYVWFEKAYNSENDSTTIHPYNEYTAANYGSLPYGTYIIKEEACAANEGHQLEPAHEFIITKQGVTVRVWDRESEQRTHNIYNVKKPTIKTTAKSTVTQEHFMIQSKEYVDYANQTINDVVDYTKLRANSNYTLVAKLMILSQDGSVRPYKEVVDGQERDYVRLHTFKTKETYLKTIYEVDGSETVVLDKVDPSGLEEKQEKLVVYEYLYYQIIENVDDIPTDEAALQYPGYVEKDGMWFFPLKHDNPLDTAQTVTIPDIHTTIKDSVSEDHIAHTSAQTTLVDRVYYTGLEVGKPYKMTGTLQVKEGTDWSHVKYDPADPNADEDGFVYDTTDTIEPTVENPDAQTPDGQGNTTTEPSNGTDGQTTNDDQVTNNDQISNTDGQNTDDQTNDTNTNDTNTTDNTNNENQTINGEQTDANTIVMDKVYTLRDAEGNVIQAEPVEFVPETSEGYVDIVFTFDSTALEGKSVVAFEECWYNDLVVSVHHDLNDEDETIHFPKFVTTSRNSLIEKYTDIKDGEEETAKQVPAENLNGESFTDTIHFTNLIANRTYKVVGTLMDSETGEVLKDASGKEITAERTFNTAEMEAVEITTTPDAFDFTTADGEVLDLASDHANYLVNGDIDLPFEGFDFSNLDGKTGVVFEKAYLVKEVTVTSEDGTETKETKDISIGEHEDLKDTKQFIYFAEGHTNATDLTTQTKVAPQDAETTIEDVFTYKNLIPGKTYKIEASLRAYGDKSGTYKDGDILKDKDGKDIIVVIDDFVPEKSEGEYKINIPFNTTALRGMEVVVFEDVYNNYGLNVLTHHDLEDRDQTVEIPNGRTTVVDSENKEHIIFADKEVTVIDTITYENLYPGVEYTATGVLMDKATGKELIVDGKKITNTVKFTPTEKNGTVEVPFTFNATGLENKKIVVFENVKVQPSDVDVIIHHDINDVDQTFNIPEGSTTAIDKATKDKVVSYGEEITIVDTITYKNLVPGIEYEATGTLMDKKTGKEIEVDGKKITNTVKFTPKEEDGTVEVPFTFNSTTLEDKVIVVFEDVKVNGKTVLIHQDLEDEDQTVYVPKLRTTATVDSGKKEVKANAETVIIDKVEYTNLVVGKEYTVKGVLMDKSTGKELIIDGKTITAEKTFKADKADGYVELEFKFNSSKLGTDIVVFEDLYHENVKVATHSDITDKDQTITIIPESPKTGDSKRFPVEIPVVIALSLIGLGFIVVKRRKKN